MLTHICIYVGMYLFMYACMIHGGYYVVSLRYWFSLLGSYVYIYIYIC